MPRTLTIDDYEITREGQVINKKSKRILKGQPNGKGYLRVSIGGKLQFIHRLVAQKYVPNPDCLEQVNHKDGNKLNNNADNLEWVSNQTNRDHAIQTGLQIHGEECPWAKLTWADVDFIRTLQGYKTAVEVAEYYGVSRTTISGIWNGRTWKKVEKIC